jgi:hypothetical protein
MKNLVYYVYNLVYNIFRKQDNPEITTWLYFNFILYMISNIIIDRLKSVKYFYDEFDSILHMLLFLFWSILFFFLTVHKKRYLAIISNFENENKRSRILGTIVFIFFTTLIVIVDLGPFFIKAFSIK